MCQAITKSGNVCKIKTNNYFCHVHTPCVSLEEQREEMLQKLVQPDTPFNFFECQRKAWPLFKDIDLISETLEIIRVAKDLGDWPADIYDSLISTYLDDDNDNNVKYGTIKRTISEYTRLQGKKDALTLIKTLDLYKDLNFLFLKVAMSRGTYWEGLKDAKYVYTHIVSERENFVNKYREQQLNILRVKEVEKHTPICDDIRKYIIAQYL